MMRRKKGTKNKSIAARKKDKRIMKTPISKDNILSQLDEAIHTEQVTSSSIILLIKSNITYSGPDLTQAFLSRDNQTSSSLLAKSDLSARRTPPSRTL
jgi:hypothetical protein